VQIEQRLKEIQCEIESNINAMRGAEPSELSRLTATHKLLTTEFMKLVDLLLYRGGNEK
jgi:hypothetical protein